MFCERGIGNVDNRHSVHLYHLLLQTLLHLRKLIMFYLFKQNCIFASNMHYWVLYILLLCVGIGCTDEKERAAIRILDRAEMLMTSYPEEACACLDSISTRNLSVPVRTHGGVC